MEDALEEGENHLSESIASSATDVEERARAYPFDRGKEEPKDPLATLITN